MRSTALYRQGGGMHKMCIEYLLKWTQSCALNRKDKEVLVFKVLGGY